MLAVLLSERADRTIVSTAVVFLAAGFAIGTGGFGWVVIPHDSEVLAHFAELSLFVILFVEGAHLPLSELRAAWKLPGRALLIGLPLTLLVLAAAGHLMLDMSWTEAFLVGAILSPTDPVFVAAILERVEVPLRLRRLLSVESGLNDGLVLPVVMVLIAVAGHREVHPTDLALETLGGILVGVAVPAVFLWLERRSWLAATETYRPLGGIAVAGVLLGLNQILGTNEFLAAYAGGITLVTLRPDFAESLHRVGTPAAEAIKLATLLVFGAVLTLPFLSAPGWWGLAFALVALLAARPLGLVLALMGGGLSRKEWLAAAWFGPKGFASLLYALIMLQAGLARGERLFQVIGLVIVLSIVAHSSTDVAVARVFAEEEAGKREERAASSQARGT